jgi:hypothetical protein
MLSSVWMIREMRVICSWMVGEPGHQGRHRRELLRGPRPVDGETQLGLLVLEVLGEATSLAGQLLGEELELTVLAIDVGLHRQLRV